jgi:5'/3'-nucleotidase
LTKRNLRILLTNDDGIHAPGLAVLEKIAATLSDDVWVVAPDAEQSGASHSLTLHLPLRLSQFGDKRFAVHGTPTDCVMMGVKHIQPKYGPDKPFDLVLSGVNRGSNIADDVTYSGTVAGAMEGTALGIPSIALSQTYAFLPGSEVDWSPVEAFGPGVLGKLLDQGWPKNVLLNINFPAKPVEEIKQVEVTRQGARDQSITIIDEREDPRGTDYFWIGFRGKLSNPPEGTDLRAIYDGRISITPLHLNLTEKSAIANLAAAIGGAPPK